MLALILCGFGMLSSTFSADILAVFPHTGKSHFDVFEPLVLELAARGHHLTVISFYPQKSPVGNLTDVSLVGLVPLRVNQVKFDEVENPFTDFISMSNMGLEMCEKILNFSPVKKLLQSKAKFNLILLEFFNTNCFLSLVHKYKTPFIAFGSSSISPEQEDRVGNPWLPAYVSHPDLPYSHVMGLPQKLVNVVYSLATRVLRAYFTHQEQLLVERLMGEVPPLESVARDVSLVLVNAHFSVLRPRPLVPGLVEVGGIHIRPPKPLDKELERYLNESTHGVLLFSMGSVLRSSSLPADKRQGIMDALGELPVRVLVKWEDDALPGKPPNVRISKWLPQRGILAHPRVVAFMGHGGMLSTSEAVHHGVPMVLIPMFGDQPNNAAHLAAAGAAIRLPYHNLSKETVLRALNAVLYDPKYRERVQALSAQFRDRPSSPLDTAVFWTEYVLRHKGAHHIRSPAVEIPWYQLWLVDIMLVLFAAVSSVLLVVYWLVRCTTILFRGQLFSSGPKKKRD